jgi:hypothetical protein
MAIAIRGTDWLVVMDNFLEHPYGSAAVRVLRESCRKKRRRTMNLERLRANVKSALDYARAEVLRNGRKLRTSRDEILLLALEQLRNVKPPVMARHEFTVTSFGRWIAQQKQNNPALRETWLVCKGRVSAQTPVPVDEEPQRPNHNLNGSAHDRSNGEQLKSLGTDRVPALEQLLGQQAQLLQQVAENYKDTSEVIGMLSTALEGLTGVAHVKIAGAVKEGVTAAVTPLAEKIGKSNDLLHETTGWIAMLLDKLNKQFPEEKDESSPQPGKSPADYTETFVFPKPEAPKPPTPVLPRPASTPPKSHTPAVPKSTPGPTTTPANENRTLGARQSASAILQTLCEEIEAVYDNGENHGDVKGDEDDLARGFTPAMLEWAKLSKRIFKGKPLKIAIVGGKPSRYQQIIPRVLEQLSAADYVSVPTAGQDHGVKYIKEQVRRCIRKDHCQVVVIVTGWCDHGSSDTAAAVCEQEGVAYARACRLGQTHGIVGQLLTKYGGQLREMLVEEKVGNGH